MGLVVVNVNWRINTPPSHGLDVGSHGTIFAGIPSTWQECRGGTPSIRAKWSKVSWSIMNPSPHPPQKENMGCRSPSNLLVPQKDAIEINPFTPLPTVNPCTKRKGACPWFSPASPGKVIFVTHCCDRHHEGSIRICLWCIYLVGVLEKSGFVISNFTYEFPNGSHTLKDQNFQVLWKKHSFLEIEMKR